MKKTLLLLLFLPLFSFAQQTENQPGKNELGLNLFSVTNFFSYKDMTDKRFYKVDVNAFSGIYYRRHFGRYALRASFDYSSKAFNAFSGPYWHDNYFYGVSAQTKNISASVGYQHAFATKKFQPYFFTDLVFNYWNYTGHSTYLSYIGTVVNQKFSEERLEYGLSAGAGLRYSITPKIHLTYEFAAHGVVTVFQDVMYAGEKFVDVEGNFNPVNKVGFAVSF
jgi:hypothetical protein